MAHPIKGSVIVADGNGKVTVISPTSNNQVLSLDSNEPAGAKFIDIKSLMPQQFIKAQATASNGTSSTTYERIMSITIPGESTNPITLIKILSGQANNANSHDIRIQTNLGVTIAEANFTNTAFNNNNMGTLSNLPQNETTIEVQAKRNGGNNNTNVYILEVTINYQNV